MKVQTKVSLSLNLKQRRRYDSLKNTDYNRTTDAFLSKDSEIETESNSSEREKKIRKEWQDDLNY